MLKSQLTQDKLKLIIHQAQDIEFTLPWDFENWLEHQFFEIGLIPAKTLRAHFSFEHLVSMVRCPDPAVTSQHVDPWMLKDNNFARAVEQCNDRAKPQFFDIHDVESFIQEWTGGMASKELDLREFALTISEQWGNGVDLKPQFNDEETLLNFWNHLEQQTKLKTQAHAITTNPGHNHEPA